METAEQRKLRLALQTLKEMKEHHTNETMEFLDPSDKWHSVDNAMSHAEKAAALKYAIETIEKADCL